MIEGAVSSKPRFPDGKHLPKSAAHKRPRYHKTKPTAHMSEYTRDKTYELDQRDVSPARRKTQKKIHAKKNRNFCFDPACIESEFCPEIGENK